MLLHRTRNKGDTHFYFERTSINKDNDQHVCNTLLETSLIHQEIYRWVTKSILQADWIHLATNLHLTVTVSLVHVGHSVIVEQTEISKTTTHNRTITLPFIKS